MGIFKNSRIIKYQNEEIKRLERNLKKLANGEFDLYLESPEGDNSLGAEREQFERLNQYLVKIKESCKNLDSDADNMAKNVNDGNLSWRVDTAKYNGLYSHIGKNINLTIENVSEPLYKTIHSLEAMDLNDYTVFMEDKYNGDFASLVKIVNALINNLKSTQEELVKVANGDFSDIKLMHSIVKRSENDLVVPSFIKLLESVDGVCDEIELILGAVENGDLNFRANAEKFNGKYKEVVTKANEILNAIFEPFDEINKAVLELEKGNLNYSIKGKYKGEFGIVTECVNKFSYELNDYIKEVDVAMEKIASGDFTLDYLRPHDGDFASISISINKLLDSMNQLFGEIKSAAEQVSAGASQISDSSQSLSQGAEEQAASIEEITASIAELAAAVKNNAANTAKSDEYFHVAKTNIEKGNQEMQAMLEAMHDINESSSKISKIIKVIDDIAFQTNILALNAAVEAARAGQYGKGFAVVAEEVKNLALQSANASKETTTMIESSIDKVAIGTKIVNHTAEGLDEIVKSIEKAAELGDLIASASNEQATAISQLNQAIEQVSQVVQNNSATAEESASASEELAGQAEMLKNYMEMMKIKDVKKDLKLESFDKLSPEIMKAIEEIVSKNNNMQIVSAVNKKDRETSVKPQILLDDKEFGKY